MRWLTFDDYQFIVSFVRTMLRCWFLHTLRAVWHFAAGSLMLPPRPAPCPPTPHATAPPPPCLMYLHPTYNQPTALPTPHPHYPRFPNTYAPPSHALRRDGPRADLFTWLDVCTGTRLRTPHAQPRVWTWT